MRKSEFEIFTCLLHLGFYLYSCCCLVIMTDQMLAIMESSGSLADSVDFIPSKGDCDNAASDERTQDARSTRITRQRFM